VLFLIRPYPGGLTFPGCPTTVFDYVFGEFLVNWVCRMA
jgi:hypothetical protein